VDHGPVLGSAQVLLLDADTYATLADKLAEASARLLIDILPQYVTGVITPVAQNEVGATYTKKFGSEDGRVSLTMDDPVAVWRKVRALNPEPSVWTMKDGRRMKILAADLTEGKLVLRKVQFDGGKVLDLI
jgi:methionyl-tRNA formyltransferase